MGMVAHPWLQNKLPLRIELHFASVPHYICIVFMYLQSLEAGQVTTASPV